MNFCMPYGLFVNVCILTEGGGGLALFKPTYSAPQLLQPCYGPVTIFFCSGKSENDLSVRDFSSHRACTFILQSLRLPFNLCTSLEELYFRD